MATTVRSYRTQYTGEYTQAQVDGFTKLGFPDFTGSLTYGVYEQVGTDDGGAGVADIPVYVVRLVVVNANDLVGSVHKFVESVRYGSAFSLAGTSTT